MGAAAGEGAFDDDEGDAVARANGRGVVELYRRDGHLMGQEQEHEGVRSTEGQPLNPRSNAKNLAGGGTSSSRRIGYIDALKGFGILCVVLGHVNGTYMASGMFPEAAWLFHSVYNLIFSFHMPLFFAISGFVYFKAYFDQAGNPRRERILRQVLNLVLIYVVFSLGYGACKVLFSRFVNDTITWRDLLLIGLYPIETYWYLYVLIEFYLFFLIPALTKRNGWLLLISTLALNCFSIFVKGPCQINSFCYDLFFFLLGLLMARDGKQVKRPALCLCLTCVSAVLLAVFWDDKRNMNGIPIVNTITATGLLLGIWYGFKTCKPLGENKVLQFFGKHSLEIYVLHGIIVSAVRALLTRFIPGALLNIAMNFVISVSVPVLFALTCQKIGIYKSLFKPISLLKHNFGVD